jgi:ADP-heptose:LPS heptosyltransferase
VTSRHRIAVLVSGDMLGDALMRVPFLVMLRRAYPEHEIWWIASAGTTMAHLLRPLTAGLIDTVVEEALLDKPMSAVIPRLRALPQFDLVFDARTRIATVLLAKLCLRPRAFFGCLPGFLFSTRRPPGRWSRPENMAERMASLVEAATGRPLPRKVDLALSPAARAAAAELLPACAAYLGFAPGASTRERTWPLDRFHALARAFADQGYVPVFLFAPNEQALLESTRSAVPGAVFPEQEAVRRGLPADRMELLVAIGERLRAAVTNDSGPAHALALAGTPLVTLHGPTHARRWGAWVEPKRTIQAQSLGGTIVPDIPLDLVTRELTALLDELGPSEVSR